MGGTVGVRDRKTRIPVWPELVLRETVAALAALIVLLVLAMWIDAPLEGVADPSMSMNPSKAPWYFLGLQELLVYFDPWIAGVAIPLLSLAALAAIPYLDPGACRGRRSLVPAGGLDALFTGGLVLWVALTVIGLFFRGPNWSWRLPWGGRAGHAAVPAAMDWVAPVIMGAYALWLIAARRRLREQIRSCGIRICFHHLLAMAALGILVKIVAITIIEFSTAS